MNKRFIKESGVRVRSSPDVAVEHNIIEKLPEGFEVYVVREEGEWSAIEYTKRGWVNTRYLTSQTTTISFKFLHNPLDEKEITQHFGEDPDLYSRWGLRGHHGIDLRTKSIDGSYNKNVYAVLDGLVIEATENDNNGKFVRLQHGGKSQTVYLHLDSHKVTTDQEVKAGNILGISGNTGFSGGPHLHFGYRPDNFDLKNGYMGYVNPETFLI